MSGSLTPGINAPTVPPPIPPPGVQAAANNAATAPPLTGLINTAPSTAKGVTGAPQTVGTTTVNPYATTNATSTDAAPAVASTPNAFKVDPNATVSGQISNIIASGSPLMQQAEANARNLMNQRGLINSSQGITAGQSALYTAATPIATADASTYNQAATNTTTAQNTALAAQAAATNTAGLQNASLATQTSQANAAAANTASGAAQSTASSQNIAQIQANTSLTNQEKQDQTTLQVQGLQSQLQKELAKISADTSLSIAQQQTQSAQTIAQWNNQNAAAIAAANNAAAMANIQANGAINTQIQNLTDNNKTLLQTSASASALYTQMLTNLSAIMTNPNLSTDQQTTALNNGVKQLQDGLTALNSIASNQQANSTLVFGSGSSTATATPTAAASSSAADQAAYIASVFGGAG